MSEDTLAGIRVVTISGEEFQRMERYQEILDEAVDESTRDFNMDVFTQENFNPETLAEVIVTFPMMAARRVAVVRDFHRLQKETQKKASEAIKDTPDTTLVIIEGEKVTLNPKPPSKYLRAESFKIIYENKLPVWIQGRFSRRGRKIRPDAVALLINNVGIVLGELDNEIEKVCIAAAGRDTLTVEDVSQVVGEFRRDTIWNLCNAVGLGDFDSAAGILGRLLESEKNRETYYISTIAAHILKIAEYNRQRRDGVPHNEAMKTVTTSPFLWKLNRMDDQVRRYGEREVRRALKLLTRIESKFKKLTVDKRTMMEILVPLLTAKRRGEGRA